ncbi:unnamed protein product [Leuciscus chuanchicus]
MVEMSEEPAEESKLAAVQAIYISRPETAERWNQNSQHPSVQEAHLDLTQWLHCAKCLLSGAFISQRSGRRLPVPLPEVLSTYRAALEFVL